MPSLDKVLAQLVRNKEDDIATRQQACRGDIGMQRELLRELVGYIHAIQDVCHKLLDGSVTSL